MVMRAEEGVSEEVLMEDVHVGRRRVVVDRKGEAFVWREEEDGSNAWASHCMPWGVVGEQVEVRRRTIAADISMMLVLRCGG